MEQGEEKEKFDGKKIEGATALRPLRPLSIAPLSFSGFPAQSDQDNKPGPFSWQGKSAISTVESCAKFGNSKMEKGAGKKSMRTQTRQKTDSSLRSSASHARTTFKELLDRYARRARGRWTRQPCRCLHVHRAAYEQLRQKSVAEGLAPCADDCLTKPFDAEELRLCGRGVQVIKTQREIEAKTKALALDARTDPLTSLPNRRALEGWAVKQISGAFRHGYPIWVVLADLDCYKPAADLFGRAAGDAMLQAFAEIIRKNTRISDVCGETPNREPRRRTCVARICNCAL